MKHGFKLLLASLLLTSLPAHAAPERYSFDKEHTTVLFFINHLGFSDTIGKFTDFDGKLVLDEAAPEQSTLDVSIKTASVLTSSAPLDKKLQGKDWFNSAEFPEMRFVSKSVVKTGDKTADVSGDITILGVTKPIKFAVRLNKIGTRPITNQYSAGFNAEATLKRSDFGLSNGIPYVGDDVHILISTEFTSDDIKTPEPAVVKH